MNIDKIEREIIHYISNSSSKVTPHYLKKYFSARHGVPKKYLNICLNSLLQRAILEYCYVFGSTYLVLSFSKAVKLSDRIVIYPEGLRYQSRHDENLISLSRGVAFGYGGHPTTRLATRMLDFFINRPFLETLSSSSALDIGTGSGILAIVAAILGSFEVLAIDIDSCARNEAEINVSLNSLDGKIKVSDFDTQQISGSFSLIIANLRYPTVKNLLPQICRILSSNGYFVISGVRTYEMKKIIRVYSSSNFRCIRREDEKGWSSVLLHRAV